MDYLIGTALEEKPEKTVIFMTMILLTGQKHLRILEF